MRRKTVGASRLRFAVPVLLLLGASHARAYDGDTHYAWTYYLALHVGYSPRQAYQIASAAWAIDHDPHTGPMHATKWDVLSGAPDPVIERVWRRFHAFADAVWVRGGANVSEVARGRRESEEALAAIGARQGNPGARIHNLQDYFAHHEYDSVRGHAAWGHVPDRIGHRPNRARAMTRRTIQALAEFAPQVGVAPRVPDETRLFEVLDRLSRANPPLLQVEPANYDVVWDAIAGIDVRQAAEQLPFDEAVRKVIAESSLPGSLKEGLGIRKIAWGDVSLVAAVAVVNEAVAEDQDVGRLHRYPADWRLPAAWIQYDFDAEGAAVPATLARNHFAVERLKVTFGESSVAFRRDPSTASLWEVSVEQRYTIEGMATLPAFRALPVQERSAWSDDAEQIRMDRDRGNGTYTIQRKVFRPLAALRAGTLTWSPSVVLHADEEAKAPPVKIRFDGDFQWYVLALEGRGIDVRTSGGVATGRPGEEARPGLSRRTGRQDLAVVRVERGTDPAVELAEVRRAVAEPRCRRPATLPSGGPVEPPGAVLSALPEFWETVKVELRGPFASESSARSALRPAAWEPVGFEPRTDFTDLEFRSGCRVGSGPPAPVAVTVPDVSGASAEDASARLEALGFRPEQVPGAAARSRAEQYTVESQEPRAGEPVAKGSVVRIAIRRAWAPPARAVPGVVGLSAAAADAALKAAGFGVTLEGGDPAPTADRAFTVQGQRPAGGATAPAGSPVTLRVHSAAAARRSVPALVGLAAAEASRRLEELGLVADLAGGDPPPTAERAYAVQSQVPAPGASMDAGGAVRLRVHSAWVAPVPTVVPPPVPGGTPVPALTESVPGADPGGWFLCPAYGTTPERRRPAILTNGSRCSYNDAEVRNLFAMPQWSPPGDRHEWKTCGTALQVQQGQGNVYFGNWSLSLYSAQRRARVWLNWSAPVDSQVPASVHEIARRVLAEAERFGTPCAGSTNASPAAGSPTPPPPVAAGTPVPAAPVDSRLPCTCRDATGKPYRMTVSGAECDPSSWLRSDDCRP